MQVISQGDCDPGMLPVAQHAAPEAGAQEAALQAALLSGCNPLMQLLLDMDRAAGVMCDLALARLQAGALQHLAACSPHDAEAAADILSERCDHAAVAICSAADDDDMLQQCPHKQAAVQQEFRQHLQQALGSVESSALMSEEVSSASSEADAVQRGAPSGMQQPAAAAPPPHAPQQQATPAPPVTLACTQEAVGATTEACCSQSADSVPAVESLSSQLQPATDSPAGALRQSAESPAPCDAACCTSVDSNAPPASAEVPHAAAAADAGQCSPADVSDTQPASPSPLRRRSGRIAGHQGQSSTDGAEQAADAVGPSRQWETTDAATASGTPPQQPPTVPMDEHGAAALRLAFAMSVLFFMALFLPVLAPRASSQTSPVLFTAVLGAMTLAVVFAPALKRPAARLIPAFRAADWEASFLFHDSRSRQLADAMASITACASCTVRLYRALRGDCSGSVAQAAPVMLFFGLQALPLVLICCRSLWYVRNREAVLSATRFGTAALFVAWTVGAIPQCRSRNDDLNWLAMGALAVHHALSFQIRFDRHMLLCALAEAPAALLPLLSAPHAGAPGFRLLPPLLRWAAAVVAAPAAAVWLTERRSRSDFAAAQRMGEPGVPAPRPPPDAFFRPPILSAPDSAAVLAKLASAHASPYVPPPRLTL